MTSWVGSVGYLAFLLSDLVSSLPVSTEAIVNHFQTSALDLDLLIPTTPQFFYIDTSFSQCFILSKWYIRIYSAIYLLLYIYF